MRAASPEAALRGALDAAPAPVRLWWRDDDAGRDHPRLAALLDIARRREAPLALAVVPAWLEPACAARVLACPLADVLQHGISHGNHGRPPAKKIELGGAADPSELRTALAAMRVGLAERFGARALPVLVPPWNRIAPDLLPALPGLGFVGWSGFGPRPAPLPVPGLVQVNTHLDLIRWREAARPMSFAQAALGLAALVRAGRPEPIGILSHHLVSDGAGFAALDRLLGLVQDHPRARFGSIRNWLEEA
jgi:hypothetical protein